MMPTSPIATRALLRQLGVQPSKSLGQNFLVDGNVRDIIIEAAGLAGGEIVLEIGAGLGELTEGLADRAGSVIAVEIDGRLSSYLRERFANRLNVEIVCGDALSPACETAWKDRADKVVANLPYSAGSRVLAEIVMGRKWPRTIVVTVQLEVAERLCAGPGGRDYGLLGLWLQSVYKVRRLRTISGSCFWPRPRVESALLVMERRDDAPAGLLKDRALFFQLTKHAFNHRRKQIAAVLKRAHPTFHEPSGGFERAFAAVGTQGRARPEELSAEQWCGLTNLLTGDNADAKTFACSAGQGRPSEADGAERGDCT